MNEWLFPTLLYLPVYGLFFAVLGVPWALVLLPRPDWRDRVTVIALGLALGPVIGTTWLFLIGTFASFDLWLVLGGIIALAVAGGGLAWGRAKAPVADDPPPRQPLTLIEIVLIVMLALGFVVHMASTAFWPFTQYDVLWTFGYNPRLFLIANEIPADTAYYPQLVPLTYSFSYFISGEINDHIARTAIPWFMLAALTMAYALGWRLWGSRRIGLITAALYFLMPNALRWSTMGDLEHVMPIYFTGATLFFVLAWQRENYRYAAIAGLMCAGALWTKPTGAAWPLGVVLLTALLLAGWALVPRVDLAFVRRKFPLAVITGLVTLPIGAMWYIRNFALGHNPIDMPPGYWTDLAVRSGRELSWLILIALIAALLGVSRLRGDDRLLRRLVLVGGFALVLLATIPSMIPTGLPSESMLDNVFIWFTTSGFIPRRALGIIDYGLLAVGLGAMVWALFPLWRGASPHVRQTATLLGILSLPFLVVWYMSYSYHFRLMLTVVPVLAAFTAALMDTAAAPLLKRPAYHRLIAFGVFGLAFIGPSLIGMSLFMNMIVNPLTNVTEKYRIDSASIVRMAEIVEAQAVTMPEPLRIHTFNEMRLKFFFPAMETITRTNVAGEMPATLAEVMGEKDMLIAGAHAEYFWTVEGLYPNEMSSYMDLAMFYSGQPIEFIEGWWPFSTVVADLGTRPPLLYGDGERLPLPLQMIEYAGGNLPLAAYTVHPEAAQFTVSAVDPPHRLDAALWAGLMLGGLEFRDATTNTAIIPSADGAITVSAGDALYVQLYWTRTDTDQPPAASAVAITLIDADGEAAFVHLSPPAEGAFAFSHMAYSFLLPDRHVLTLPDDLPSGLYDLRIAPVDVDGDAVTVAGAVRVDG